MNRILFIFSLVIFFTKTYAQVTPTASTIERVASTADLVNYKGDAQVLLVTNNNDGGIFYYSKDKNVVDNGVVYPGANKGYWIRMYDKANGVELAWFGAKMDSVTDDGDALKRALTYNYIKINGNIALSSKTAIVPEGKTVEFTSTGAITITDTFILRFNGFIKANDYQYIFRGTGKAVLGSNSAPYISACWFGARSDCPGYNNGKGNDNTIPIQKAINAATKVSDVYLPPAPSNTSYRITSTITITKKAHFFSFRFHGGGTTITENPDDRATKIFADFKDGSAINVQGSRRVYISDLLVHGINYEPHRIKAWNDSITFSQKVTDPATFLSEGVKISYAGITTDVEKQNKVWSADVVFERLQIENFSIGIGISQGGNYQGDRMRVENTQINECVYGISIGQAQNRACHFYNVDMNNIWCGITNTTFGDHTGSEFQVTGGQWCHIYKCFDMRPSYAGQCVISGLYTEAVGMIGTFGNNNPNNAAVLFTGCLFFMQDNGLHMGTYFNPPFYSLWAYGNITFEGCNFWAGRHFIAFYAGCVTDSYTGSTITLNGCAIHKCTSIHVKGNSSIENTFFVPASEFINYNRNIMTDFEGNNRINTGFTPFTVTSGMEVANANNSKKSDMRQVTRMLPRFYTVQDAKEGISNIQLSHDTLQFNYSEALGKTFFRYLFDGDVIGTPLKSEPVTGWDNPTLEIIDIDTTNRKITAWAHTSDFTFDKIGLYTTCFFTTHPITGIVKYGSNTITDVVNSEKLRSGDFITFKESGKAYRIGSINNADSSLILLDPISEQVNGRVTLYNELLSDNTAEETNNTGIRTITESSVLSATDHTVIVNTAASSTIITVTLPSGIPIGHTYCIKKTTGSQPVNVVATNSTIDGKSSYTLKDEYQDITIQYDGSNYYILGR